MKRKYVTNSIYLLLICTTVNFAFAQPVADTRQPVARSATDLPVTLTQPDKNLLLSKQQFNNPSIPDDYPNHIILKFRDDIPVRSLAQGSDPIALQKFDFRKFEPLINLKKRSPGQKPKEFYYLPYLAMKATTLKSNVATVQTSATGRAVPNNVAQELAQIKQRLNGDDVQLVSSVFQSNLTKIQNLRLQSGSSAAERLPDMENFYRIQVKQGEPVADFINTLKSYSIVETAYLAPIPQDADILPITPNLQADQRYLNAAPTGIAAQSAWNQVGGDGSGVTIIDVEGGWNTQHEDLNNPVSTSGINLPDTNHGTAVLGVMVAGNDGSGMTGISFNANYGTASVVRSVISWWSVADAVIHSVGLLNAGDIIVIEQHAPDFTPFNNSNDGTDCGCNCSLGSQHRYLPMEYFPAEFAAIKYATASGISVIEAAGNGGQNLDHPNFDSRFTRSNRDSGAILVGASVGGTNRSPACFTNSGSRVDLQGWGGNVATLGYGVGGRLTGGVGRFANNTSDSRQWYTGGFSGTSSATPIVAGAAASLQGVKLARDSVPLTPPALRTLLVNTGTPQTGAPNIGPQPRLDTALTSLIGQPPQIPTIGNTCSTPATISDDCGGNSCVEQRVGTERIPPGEPNCLFLNFFCEEQETFYRIIYENICVAP